MLTIIQAEGSTLHFFNAHNFELTPSEMASFRAFFDESLEQSKQRPLVHTTVLVGDFNFVRLVKFLSYHPGLRPLFAATM